LLCVQVGKAPKDRLCRKVSTYWFWFSNRVRTLEQFTRSCSQSWVCEEFQAKTWQILEWLGS